MYERFWDIHLSAGAEFDFPNDVAEYARYQRQLKTQNKIAGPALILVEQFGAWGKSAALLLSRFEGIEVWVEADVVEKIVTGTTELMRGLHQIEPNQAKTIRLRLPKLLATVLKSRKLLDVPEKRFSVEVNSSDVAAPKDPGSYACRKEADGVYVFSSDAGMPPTGDIAVFGIPKISDKLRVRLLSEKLSGAGYLATMVDFNDVDKAVASTFVASAVNWLVGKPSKLRINSHGDGEGNLEMGVSATNKRKMPTSRLVDWLAANGLTARGEWKTFSVFVCMAARFKDIPAGREDALSSPATQSAVWDVADALREKGITGVKVTGANEVVWGVAHVDGISTTGGIQPGQAVQMIAIPQGWTFAEGSLTVTVPDDWKIEQLVHQGKRRIILSLKQAGAKVVPNPGTGWNFEAAAKKYIIPLDGWTVDQAKALLIATDGWRHQEGGRTLRYDGSGGTVGLRKTAEGAVKIIERLAKSGAKFAAIS
jgi:hypothetical protein